MPLSAGTRLGPYEILAPIGAGGMGEVYRARDTNLDRDVAIKVLPAALAQDPERLARFEREAKVLAALNHSNIAQIYGLEQRALVMELVEGETLKGPLPVETALSYARQIADALEAAHEKGITHRDLKPANIMITPAGVVKVLDFGLAAVAQDPASGSTDPSNSPTLTMRATQAGMIMGTAAYMSPEQAAGKPVDKRADIWSFGVVLWEMLTGHQLFGEGETISHTLADVLRAPIDIDKLPKETPRSIRELLRRCLDRDVKSRLRDIGEARVAIERYSADPAITPQVAAVSRSNWMAWGVAGAAIACAAALAVVHFREQPPVAEAVRFQIVPPENTTFTSTAVLSPDGRRLVFDAPGPSGRNMLWIRSLGSLEARILAGTEGAQQKPFWSPDSRFIAFAINGFPGKLKKVEASGGPPQTLCDYSAGIRGGTWNREGVIVFGTPGGLWRVAEAGGTTSPVTRLDPSRGENEHAQPLFMPDGRQFLYHRTSNAAENNGIYIGSLDVKPEQQSTKRLLASDSSVEYVASPNLGASQSIGYLLFLREGSLLAQPFDSRRLEPTGEPIPIAEDIGSLGTYGWFSASATGALAFRTGRDVLTNANRQLLWFDRGGKQISQLGPPANYNDVHLSPDGKKVVVDRTNSGGATYSVWTADIARGIFSRLNVSEGSDLSGAVSPDGRVAFSSTLNGAVGDLYWRPASGVGGPEPLLVKSLTVKHANHISLDGRFLIYDDHHPTQRQDLWILPLFGDRKPIPFVVTSADETFGQFSPDGKWIAYSSDESGKREVYVQGFAPDRSPAVGVGKWQISTAGGDKPRWRRDGKELYYIAPDRKLMAVPLKTSSTFEPGVAIPLFATRVTGFFPYDVAADGRFLLNTVTETATSNPSPVTVELNWQASLKK